MTTKEFIQMLCQHTGRSQTKLTQILGVNKGRISEYSNGTKITLELAQEYCKKLGTTLDAILAKHAQDKSLESASNQYKSGNK